MTQDSHTLMARALAVGLVGLALAGPAQAGFSQLVAFGDSLSDTGNVHAFSLGLFPPTPPYYAHRFSNGPVAVDYLADALGGPPLTSHAWGGATTGTGNRIGDVYGLPGLLGLRQQIDNYASGGSADADALYVVWAGSNDLFNWLDDSGGVSRGQYIAGMADNLGYAVDTLEGLGARHILVPNLPNIGGLGAEFDVALDIALAARAALPGFAARLYGFDVLGRTNAILDDPLAYGYTDLFTPCLSFNTLFSYSLCSADPAVQNTHLMWDSFNHPTTPWHQVMGTGMAQAVPEPAHYALWATGLLALAWRLGRRS
ncbi:MAG: SGNH/GDSL hydrolase family protein [Thiobacillaceae bacterium]|jgi:phospholipase/lecithinase/hemolysin|nr:SGNH/GDSL hydrolase family protein [Thiobacillaceae bacterium]